MKIQKIKLLIFLIIGFIGTSSFKSEESKGLFTCVINGRPYVVENVKASLRKITGGEQQLSLTNDRFVKFSFLNPNSGTIDLQMASIRQAYIRYEDPASNSIGAPVKGFVSITELDTENKEVSGEFEMELLVKGNAKPIKVTEGRFINVPITVK
ncbi:MAG: DUF6252 family protein [Cytophagaceae bacterium]|jgi:hypothetical protein|nr:DUF6252 family protein [Cytophagaceae bacterium]